MKYIHPPRPIGAIHPNQLPKYAKAPWLAQRKFNGTHTLIHVLPNGDLEPWRHKGEPHLQWKMNDAIKKQLASLDLEQGVEYWLDGELLNGKTSTAHYKNRIVFYDVLFAGKNLFNGPTTIERWELLSKICRHPTKRESGHGIALEVTENLWLAENFQPEEFEVEWKRFFALDEIEGLVLKQSNAKLDSLGMKYYESNWLIRCRKSHKNYTF
jgi:hypothetical protein